MQENGDFWNIREQRSSRTLIFCALGAILGLLVAGFGLFTANGTRTARVPPEDAAIVNGVPILTADMEVELRNLYQVSLSQATVEQKGKVLNDMIREELYVQRGVELGLPTDDVDVRSALVAATEGYVAADAQTQVPAEAQLGSWYSLHRNKYSSPGTMALHEFILTQAQAANAVGIKDSLAKGASPASLQLKSSGRVDDGEEFYFAAHDHLGDRIFAVAKNLRDGEISQPIVDKDGTHLLIMVKNGVPVASSYEDVRAQVRNDYLANEIADLQSRNQTFLKNRADIRVRSDLL